MTMVMTVGLLALLVTHSSGGFIPSVARSTAARYIAQFTMSTVHLYKKEEEKINKLEGNESTTSMFITQENEKRPYQSKLFTTSFLSSSFFFQIFFFILPKRFLRIPTIFVLHLRRPQQQRYSIVR